MKFNLYTIVWQQKPDFFRPLDNANPVPGKDLVETDVSGLGFRGEAVDIHVTQRKPSLVLRDDRETGTHDPGGGNPEALPHSLAEHRLARPEVARERHHVSRAQDLPQRPRDLEGVLLARRQKRNFHSGSPGVREDAPQPRRGAPFVAPPPRVTPRPPCPSRSPPPSPFCP